MASINKNPYRFLSAQIKPYILKGFSRLSPWATDTSSVDTSSIWSAILSSKSSPKDHYLIRQGEIPSLTRRIHTAMQYFRFHQLFVGAPFHTLSDIRKKVTKTTFGYHYYNYIHTIYLKMFGTLTPYSFSKARMVGRTTSDSAKRNAKTYHISTEEIHCPVCRSFITLPIRLAKTKANTPLLAAPLVSFITTETASCLCGTLTASTEGTPAIPSRTLRLTINPHRWTSGSIEFKRRVRTEVYNIPYYFRYTHFALSPPDIDRIASVTIRKTHATSLDAHRKYDLLLKKLKFKTLGSFHTEEWDSSSSQTQQKESPEFLNHMNLMAVSNQPALLSLLSPPQVDYHKAIRQADEAYPLPIAVSSHTKNPEIARMDIAIARQAATYYQHYAMRYNIFVYTSRHIFTPYGLIIPILYKSKNRDNIPSLWEPICTYLSQPLSHTLSDLKFTLDESPSVLVNSTLNYLKKGRYHKTVQFFNTLTEHLNTMILKALLDHAPFTAREKQRLTVPLLTYHPRAIHILPLSESIIQAPTVPTEITYSERFHSVMSAGFTPEYSFTEIKDAFGVFWKGNASYEALFSTLRRLTHINLFSMTTFMKFSAFLLADRFQTRHLFKELYDIPKSQHWGQVAQPLQEAISKIYPEGPAASPAAIREKLSSPPAVNPAIAAINLMLQQPTYRYNRSYPLSPYLSFLPQTSSQP